MKPILTLGSSLTLYDFDKCPDGSYHRTLEGGHGMNRFIMPIPQVWRLQTTLLRNVQQLDNVEILENAVMCNAKKTKTGFSILVLTNDNEYTAYNCRYAIFATGGIGRVYEYTTNSAIATGDGITIAHELDQTIKNLSYIQFHPTGFNNKHIVKLSLSLNLSEARALILKTATAKDLCKTMTIVWSLRQEMLFLMRSWLKPKKQALTNSIS